MHAKAITARHGKRHDTIKPLRKQSNKSKENWMKESCATTLPKNSNKTSRTKLLASDFDWGRKKIDQRNSANI